MQRHGLRGCERRVVDEFDELLLSISLRCDVNVLLRYPKGRIDFVVKRQQRQHLILGEGSQANCQKFGRNQSHDDDQKASERIDHSVAGVAVGEGDRDNFGVGSHVHFDHPPRKHIRKKVGVELVGSSPPQVVFRRDESRCTADLCHRGEIDLHDLRVDNVGAEEPVLRAIVGGCRTKLVTERQRTCARYRRLLNFENVAERRFESSKVHEAASRDTALYRPAPGTRCATNTRKR